MSTSYPKIFTKGYRSSLDATSIDDGKIRVAIDSRELFIDLDGTRLEISDLIKDFTEEQVRSLLSPLPKIYLTKDTHKLLCYTNDAEWVVCGEANPNVVDRALTADTAINATSATYSINASTATYSNKSKNASSASYANNASTSTHALSADKAIHADEATSADEATHAINADNSTEATHAMSADHANEATTATNASTATYAKNASTATYATNAGTSTHATSATKADTSTEATHATNADNASTATYAKNAGTATYGKNAGTSTYAKNAGTATHATNADNAHKDYSGKVINTTYAPLASPIFTGIPTVPTANSNDSSEQVANTQFVINAIANAIGGVTQFKTEIITELPESGQSGIIYFLAKSAEESEADNLHVEYVWIGDRFEKIGEGKIDLTGYYNSYEVTGTGNAVTNIGVQDGKLIVKKDVSFLTRHPSVTVNSSTAALSLNGGGSFSTSELELDENGHIINISKKTVTIPDKVTNAGTATYATNAGTATYGKNAGTATYSKNAGTATYSKNAGTATYATTATNASTATYATSAANATSATNAGTATYATNAGTATYANKALADASGNTLSLYVKSVKASGKNIVFTRGNASTFSVSANGTTYSNMTGATATANGKAGLVPPPNMTDEDMFLCSDGTWKVMDFGDIDEEEALANS